MKTVQSQSHITTDGQTVMGLMTRYLLLFYSYGLVFVDAISDERTGLSFVHAAGPCQRSLSRVRVPWDSRPYFENCYICNCRFTASAPTIHGKHSPAVAEGRSQRKRVMSWLPRQSIGALTVA
jgi:hypothetical protein